MDAPIAGFPGSDQLPESQLRLDRLRPPLELQHNGLPLGGVNK
jgi:hypothetical protein